MTDDAAASSRLDPAPMPPGFHAFWFWNDRVTLDGIRDQLAAMAAQGIRGVYLHPRQGLAQPYLGADFLDLVEATVAEAARQGLSVHLYDEYPYPSGAAGGGVLLDEPGLAGSRLCHIAVDAVGGTCRVTLPPGRVVACLDHPRQRGDVRWDDPVDLLPHVGVHLARESYLEEGLGPYNDRRYFAADPRPVLETVLTPGDHRVVAAVLVPITDHKYWGGFPDVLNPAAVERFLRLTHDRYAARLGDRLRAVPSVFTDEVAPWVSAVAVDAFIARTGGDAGPLLVALGEPEHPRHVEALAVMTEVQLDLFERSFERPVAAWCRRHGVRYAAEKPSLRLSQLRWLDVPGCEPGHVKAGAAVADVLRDVLRAPVRGNARATASAAYLYRKEGALCECYHSLGWDATLQDAKLLADILVALGIRWLVPHAFFYSVHGLRKHDAPPSFPHLPSWSLFGLLSRHITELLRHLDGSHPDAAIAVLDPTWGLPDEPGARCYELLQRALVERQLDWLTVDTDILAASRVDAGAAVTRDVRLRAVVIPPLRAARAVPDEWLRGFAAAGGTVLRLTDATEVATAVDTLADVCPPSLRVTATRGRREHVLCTTWRRRPQAGRGGRRLWLLVNMGAEPVELACWQPSDLRPVRLAGEAPPAVRVAGPDGGPTLLCLDPFETVLLTEGDGAAGHPSLPAAGAAVTVEIAGTWPMRLVSPNVLRLGHWWMTLLAAGSVTGSGGADTGPDDSSVAAASGTADAPRLVTPAPLANQVRRGGFRWSPRIVTGFGEPARLECGGLRVRYRAAFDCAEEVISDGVEVWLAIEPGSITGRWRLRVNDARPVDATDLEPCDHPLPGCLALPLSGLLRPGGNELVVEVDAAGLDDGLRHALYVVGAVGVRVTPLPSGELRGLLEPLPARGVLGDYPRSALPFYAGVVEYELPPTILPPVPVEAAGTAPVTVTVVPPPGCADAVEVRFGDGPWRPLPWSPRRVEVPAAELAAARVVRVRLVTGLAALFEGRRFDPVTHRYRSVTTPPSGHDARAAGGAPRSGSR